MSRIIRGEERRGPIVIPDDLAEDRAVRQLLTAWIHAHARYRVCVKRVNWKNSAAAKIEKKRRREKWQVVARILEIERTLLKWCARATHDIEIWMSKKEHAKESTLFLLESAYYRNRRLYHGATGSHRKRGMEERARLVARIRSIKRNWMVALNDAVYPGTRPPKAITLHPRELIPRKIVRASKELTAELR